jgi:hypothetical protein
MLENTEGSTFLFHRLILIDCWCFNTSFSGGGSRREPLTLGKQLVNFITCGCKSSAPFFVIYKAGRVPTLY